MKLWFWSVNWLIELNVLVHVQCILVTLVLGLDGFMRLVLWLANWVKGETCWWPRHDDSCIGFCHVLDAR